MLPRDRVAKAASAATLTTNGSTRHGGSGVFRITPRTKNNYGPLNVTTIHFRKLIHIPSFLLPPVVFTGLVLALYTWKSFVMVSLQNKIIYAPYLPPSARHEKISDYKSRNHGIEWEEFRMKSTDGTDLALAVATVSAEGASPGDHEVTHHVYILYCQGLCVDVAPFPAHVGLSRTHR